MAEHRRGGVASVKQRRGQLIQALGPEPVEPVAAEARHEVAPDRGLVALQRPLATRCGAMVVSQCSCHQATVRFPVTRPPGMPIRTPPRYIFRCSFRVIRVAEPS
ncbi:hypothetical protein SAMN05660642_01733 [Geodermatophilus siccatus]|uniref:Uncharacterized protein n=1 Tax=Geodermatophilus siccatus TaxID=1137991 RepID=A0A1G9QNT1_9ACTN|nr:hypothetical protein SAMN05660642_01733 [Geodermatophilus siccatus]